MANAVVKLALTAEGGNTINETRILVVDRIVSAVADSTKVLIKYNDPSQGVIDLLTGTLTVDQLKDAINGSPVEGAREQVLVFDPSANTADRTTAAHDLLDLNGNVFYLPDNSRIIHAFYEVITTFTSATDAATISLGIPTDDVAGIKAAIAISNGANPYDAGAFAATIQDDTVTNQSEKTTAARTIQATVAVEALTAGKLMLWVKYITTV